MRNPLNTSQGKGDSPRSCYNPKFRDGFDQINWGKKRKKKTIKFKSLIEGLRRKK